MSKLWADMTERERDAEIALAIGWRETPDEPWPWIDELNSVQSVLPSFTSSLDAMRLVEDVIEGRKLWREYLTELVVILDIYGDKGFHDWDMEWQHTLRDIFRSSAVQRAEAAWRVLKPKEP